MGSTTWSRLVVSRDLELGNKGTNTGLGLGLVAEINLVELRLLAAMNLVELGLVVVYGDGICGLGLVVVYGSGDVYGGVVLYDNDDNDGAAAA